MDVQTRLYATDLSRKSKWKYQFTNFNTGSSASIALNARIDQANNFTNVDTISMQGNSPGLGSFILGTSILGGLSISTKRTTFPSFTGHNLQLEFKESTNNAVQINHWQLYARTRGLRAS